MADALENTRRLLREAFTGFRKLDVPQKAAIVSLAAFLVCSIVASTALTFVLLGAGLLGFWTASSIVSQTQFVASDFVLKCLPTLIDPLKPGGKSAEANRKCQGNTGTKLSGNGEIVAAKTQEGQQQFSVSFNIENLICLILKDFVYSWYDTISEDENVSEKIKHQLCGLIEEELPARLSKINPISLLCAILELFQLHVHRYRRARTSLRKITRGKKVDSSSLITSYETYAILHPAVQSEGTELDYLQRYMDILQRVLLPPNIVQCNAAHQLLNEILTVNLLQSLVELISDPDTVNEIIVLILSDDDEIASPGKSGAKIEEPSTKHSLEVTPPKEVDRTINKENTDNPPSYTEAVHTCEPNNTSKKSTSKTDLKQHLVSIAKQPMCDHQSQISKTIKVSQQRKVDPGLEQLQNVSRHEVVSQAQGTNVNQQETGKDKYEDKGHRSALTRKSTSDSGSKVLQGQIVEGCLHKPNVAKVNNNSTGAFIKSTLNTAALNLIDKIGMKETEVEIKKIQVESVPKEKVHHDVSQLSRKSSGVRMAYLEKLGIQSAKQKEEQFNTTELKTDLKQNDDQNAKQEEKGPNNISPLLGKSSPQHSPKLKQHPTSSSSFAFPIPFTSLGPSFPILKPPPKSPTKKEKVSSKDAIEEEEVENLKFVPVPMTSLAPSIPVKSNSESGDTQTDTESSEGGMSRSSSTNSFASLTYADDQQDIPFEELDLQFAPESEQILGNDTMASAKSISRNIDVAERSKERQGLNKTDGSNVRKSETILKEVHVDVPRLVSSEVSFEPTRNANKRLSWQGDCSSSFEEINLVHDWAKQHLHSDFTAKDSESLQEHHLPITASSELETPAKLDAKDPTFKPITPAPTNTSPKKDRKHPAPLVRSKTTPALLNIQGLGKQELARSEVRLMEAKVGRFHISAVTVPRTEVMKDRSGKEYILYCIQYEVTAQGLASKSSSSDTGVVTKVVKRRHREFVNLHCRLDDNLRFKQVLKGIKEPPRRMGVGLAFGAISKSVYEYRRISLEHYLQQLINQPMLGHSEEIAEFLALGGDAHIEFVKKRTDIAPKIDQFLQWAVPSFVSTVKSAVPRAVVDLGTGAQMLSPPVSPKSQRKHGTRDGALSPTPQVILDMDWVHKNAKLQERNHTQVQSATTLFLQDHHEKDFEPNKIDKPRKPYPPEPSDLGPRFEGDGCDATQLAEGQDKKVPQVLPMEEIELLDKIMVLLTEAMRGQGQPSWILDERLQKGMCVVVGKPLDRWIKTQIEALTSEQWCAYYLTLIQDAIWPNGELIGSTKKRTDEEKETMRKDALQCLVDILPDPLQQIIGQGQWAACMEVLLDSLQDPQLNRHLVYTLLDLLLEVIASEIREHEFQETLLTSYTSLPQ